MALRKIKTHRLTGDRYMTTHPHCVLRPAASYIVRHDNSTSARVAGAGAHGRCYIRIPSMKRTNKVWRNFYRLFPEVYFKVKEEADKRGLKPGDEMLFPWPSTLDFWNPDSRTVKVRVLDLTGQFTQVVDKNLYHPYLWTKLNKLNKYNSKRI